MAKAQFTLEVNDQEVILVPQKHEYTLIWIHGLNETPQKHLAHMLTQPLLQTLLNFRVVLPRAPTRFVTAQKTEMASWFDIKFRNQTSFIVDFDEAFSSAEVKESYEKHLLPIIQRENKLVKEMPQRIFIGGFSQGCGMSLHCFYETKIQWAGAIGVSGYLFPITSFDQSIQIPKRIVYGDQDDLRPWEIVKVTYQNKISEEDIVMVEGVKHEMKPAMIANVSKFIQEVLFKQKTCLSE